MNIYQISFRSIYTRCFLLKLVAHEFNKNVTKRKDTYNNLGYVPKRK